MIPSQLVYVEVDKCHPNRFNPNVMNKEKFEALVDFCRTHGADQLDPIWVRRDGIDKFEIIDGEHRWKVAKEVGWQRLRAFIQDMEESDAKAFNVRKNRERGKLDAYKMGKILHAEFKKGTQNGTAKKFGLSRRLARDYVDIYLNHEAIRRKLNIGTMVPMPYRKSREVLRELKREERDEISEEPSLDVEEEQPESQQLEKFLSRYAKALKKNPLPTVQTDEVQIAIGFFKRLLEKKQIQCPICGEKHLQWRCGHEF